MELVDILIILSVMAVAFIIGRISKGPICTDKKEEVEVAPQDIYFPQITVVFQQDIDDDEDLCKEIADMLKVSESAVKKKLERARKRLKEKYESEGR